ncbi:hypothetical protein [Acinetobacter venetianus]|uniref:Uncharacterized protein n=1 Tax=Acinetobacter venetianus (strain ATCC 31012 / DSM 23050 / BCRC 14357 / CCUG 45561 / CIP 110063 / KCTC 2702 / LMG 19082 / RAG-1) TaxID=1191460 RepID=N8ZRR2_ACIVR|nr:hypothetical protein [Acinetobacter venetianus]ENV36449.1 hypothetical protein F959_02392 [Acinetobacter venetianus RAG-1 = CIP 110063]MBC9227758.1 hypothetical protein [Acinetobacter baumannii]
MTVHLNAQQQTLQTNSSFTHPLKQLLCTGALFASALLLGQATQAGGYQEYTYPLQLVSVEGGVPLRCTYVGYERQRTRQTFRITALRNQGGCPRNTYYKPSRMQLIIAETGQTVFVRSEEVRQATRQDYTGPRMKAPDKPASAKINRCHIMATQDANGKVTRGPALTDPSCQK